MNPAAHLTATRERVVAAGGSAPTTDAQTIAALLAMPPTPGGVRRGQRWAEERSQLLDDGYLYAVICNDESGQLQVTAHTDIHQMHAEWSRVSQEVLGRPRGTVVRHLPAAVLIGRTVVKRARR